MDPRDFRLIAYTYRRTAEDIRATGPFADYPYWPYRQSLPWWARPFWPIARAQLDAVARWLERKASNADQCAREVEEEQEAGR